LRYRYNSEQLEQYAVAVVNELDSYEHCPADVLRSFQKPDEVEETTECATEQAASPRAKPIVLRFKSGETKIIDGGVTKDPQPVTRRLAVSPVSEQQIISMVVQQCHLGLSIMKRNAHNEKVYDRYARRIMEDSGVPLHVQAKIIPVIRTLVFVANKTEARAVHLNNTAAVIESDQVYLNPVYNWRGWFLWSRSRASGPGQ